MVAAHECLEKRPASGSGYHSLNSARFKIPRVWAVQDFPSGCGTNSPNLELKHKENPSVIENEASEKFGRSREDSMNEYLTTRRVLSSGDEIIKPTVKGKKSSLDGETSRNKLEKPSMYRLKKPLVVAKKSIPIPNFAGRRFDRTKSSDARSKVRETLHLFRSTVRRILQGEESKSGKASRRIDLQASNVVKEKGKEVNKGPPIVGEVPGVEVGDAFQYRVELSLVGVHRLYQSGIDYTTKRGMLVATSVVASGAYADTLGDAAKLIYSGQGGNVTDKTKNPEDQKLEKGNLALKNNIATRSPVRVIRGSKDNRSSRSATLVTTYVYDGLYTVDDYWIEEGPHGKKVFMFKLVRIPRQPELNPGHAVCVGDIALGKESLPIIAVNTIDGDKPPPFKYIKKMMYPDRFHAVPPKGCDCIGTCSDAKRCSCAIRNGGEIPYNRDGAIVEEKLMVYECGPSCKCPPSCYNRVSQHGIQIPLEIFKTDKRGWGIRARSSIASGTFICEYVGEILDRKQAESRIGLDQYLFDIGEKYSGYTIDAAYCGNIARFINHSCSPNLCAQRVVYDDKMPHIMFFAAENIPPFKELSYHYNYPMNQVCDSKGNIKVKACFCGASNCRGRMY